jgi:micrococcal nuclease
MKRKIVLPVVVTLFFLLATFALSAEYWGSRNSNIYHYPTCKWAQKISPKNLVEFATPTAAASAGYRACKVCKPPA